MHVFLLFMVEELPISLGGGGRSHKTASMSLPAHSIPDRMRENRIDCGISFVKALEAQQQLQHSLGR